MMTFLGLVSIACIAVIVYVITTAATIGAAEIFMIAVFGFVAIVSMIAFSVFMIARYTTNKVKSNVRNIRFKVKKLKK